MENEFLAGPEQRTGRGGGGGCGGRRCRPFLACLPTRRLKNRRIDRCMGGMKKCMNKATFYFMLWILWMLGGTLYYTYMNELGIWVGFYQAINIGYSIGYGFPREPMMQNWWFSSIYVILGASFVGVALGFFADKIVEDSNDWFTHMMEKQQYEKDVAPGRPFLTRARAFVKYNYVPIRSIIIWFVWVAIMVMYSMIAVGWPFSQAQYFAVSTCSTGGHMPIPDDSPGWLFGVTGFFAAIGVPVMGVAMASLGSLLMERRDDLDEMKKIIEADVTGEELLELQRFGLEDGDGEVDKAEFIILCMVRLGTDPRLIQFISKEFQKLDDDGSNSLSILEITRGRLSCDDLKKLGQSEAYRSKRNLGSSPVSLVEQSERNSVSIASLPSITEDHREEICHGRDEENQSNAVSTHANMFMKMGVALENGTAETECEPLPEGSIEDDFEDNAFPSSDSEDGIVF